MPDRSSAEYWIKQHADQRERAERAEASAQRLTTTVEDYAQRVRELEAHSHIDREQCDRMTAEAGEMAQKLREVEGERDEKEAQREKTQMEVQCFGSVLIELGWNWQVENTEQFQARTVPLLEAFWALRKALAGEER